MALLSQRPAKEMRAPTRFHANQLNLRLGCEAEQLNTRKLLPNDNLAGLVRPIK
jgi:hypothetical protein